MKLNRKGLFLFATALLVFTGCNRVNNQITSHPNQEQINQHLESGERYYLNEAYDKAYEEYTKILALDEQYIDAYIHRAKVNIKRNDLPSAEMDLKKLDTLDIESKPASYYEVLAEYKMENKDFNEALSAIVQAMKLETSNRQSAIKGIIQYHLHQHQEAKVLLQQAIKDKNDTALQTYYYLLSEIGIYEGNYPVALTYLDKLKEIDAESSRVYAMQSYVYLKQITDTTLEVEKQRLETASMESLMLAKNNPTYNDDAITVNYIGLVAYLEDNLAASLASFDRAIALKADHAVFYNNRALVYYYQGDTESAYQDLTKAIEIDKLEPEFYLGRGYVLHTRGQIDASIGNFSKAVELDKNYLQRVPEDLQAMIQKQEHPTQNN